MKFLLLISMLLIGCGFFGPEYRDYRPKPKVPYVPHQEYNVIAQAIVSVKSSDGLYAVGSSTIDVTYVVADVSVFQIDVSSFVSPVETEDSIDLGTIDISNLKVTNLRQCGVTLDQQCNIASVRIYTTELVGSEGIAGFVNTTDGYGVDVTAAESGGLSGTVGLTDAAAIIVDTTSLAGDRRLTSSDFGGGSYDITADFSNAGAGDYEMDLVIEVVVAE